MLQKQFTRARGAWESRDPQKVAQFWSASADTLTPQGFVRGRDNLTRTFSRFVGRSGIEAMRFQGSSTNAASSVRAITPSVMLIDGRIGEEGSEASGWFTEIWTREQNEWVIANLRARVGSAAEVYETLRSMTSETVVDNAVPAAVAKREEKALRALFPELRKAWRTGDVKGMMRGLAPKANAIASFGFLGNRAQIIDSAAGIAEKMLRMNPAVVLRSMGASVARGESLNISGEAKSIRFLSPTVAVVDGTVELSGMPPAHGFTPKEMAGLYTDIWRKIGNSWRIEGTRPWF